MDNFELNIEGEDFTSCLIYQAIKQKNPYKVLTAIHRGEDVTLRDREFNSTYLHLLVSVADNVTDDKLVSIVYQLANAGIDVNAKDYKGRTALEWAILNQLQDIMAALLRVGVDPAEKDYKSMIRRQESPFELELVEIFEKYEPGLWSAVEKDSVPLCHMLINSWCRINTRRGDVTLLEHARRTCKSPELTSLLDDYEVTLEFVHATLAGDEKRMLEFLMDSKPCDPYIMDISHQENWSKPLSPRSLRDTAIAMGHTHVLHLLPETEYDKSGVRDYVASEGRSYIQDGLRSCPKYKNTQSLLPMGPADGYSDTTVSSDSRSYVANTPEGAWATEIPCAPQEKLTLNDDCPPYITQISTPRGTTKTKHDFFRVHRYKKKAKTKSTVPGQTNKPKDKTHSKLCVIS